MLGAYHDARCVDAAGALTKRDCACAPGGVVSRADATCGYYAAWDRANAAFLGDVFAGAVNDTGVLYEVAAPLLVPGGRVAYLPNAGRRDPLLCGDTAPLRHVKFLRKADRDLDARCGAPPPGLLWVIVEGQHQCNELIGRALRAAAHKRPRKWASQPR